jgi:F0F1-type ATP synthase assembly protein I
VSRDQQRKQTLATANLVGQVGCATALVAIVIIAIAFGIGWLLDELMGNERKFITVLLLLGSFPITLFAMVRLSTYMVGRAQEQMEQTQDDDDQIIQDNKEENTA